MTIGICSGSRARTDAGSHGLAQDSRTPLTPAGTTAAASPATGRCGPGQHRSAATQASASATVCTTGTPGAVTGRRTITTGIPNRSAAAIFGQV